MLLWSLLETAKQLGVSKRTVQRLVDHGELPCCRIGRLIRIPSDSVREYVARMTQGAHNSTCAESVAWKGEIPCHTDVRTRRIGGSVIATQPAKELDVLLERLTAAKQKRSKPSGSLKRIKPSSGVSSQDERSMS
ncbi:MAG: hypothetical protein B6D47_12710 [Rhodocyclaceae bacterium UTPRO2]|nr:MAG: hypothetical protein B6D47_12710 [Rhodocyclaceae bacterium UTPRO2]